MGSRGSSLCCSRGAAALLALMPPVAAALLALMPPVAAALLALMPPVALVRATARALRAAIVMAVLTVVMVVARAGAAAGPVTRHVKTHINYLVLLERFAGQMIQRGEMIHLFVTGNSSLPLNCCRIWG